MSTSKEQCPYTIRELWSSDQASTYLVRERDAFGEFPSIFVKVYFDNASREPDVLILSDSGTGLNIVNTARSGPVSPVQHQVNQQRLNEPSKWSLASFLELKLNAEHKAPYIVLTTHCHYDHICGIQSLLDAKADVAAVSSSHDPAYLSPWRNLQKHSLCQLIGLEAPRYDARMIEDSQRITYFSKSETERKTSSITVMHTPGHTPDSLSWYDYETRTLCVGDMLYERESDETRSGSGGQWPQEPPQPVVFTMDSNIVHWNASIHRLLDFVRAENIRLSTAISDRETTTRGYRQDGQGRYVNFVENEQDEHDWSEIEVVNSRRRVVLCAGHVTIAADAEFALLDMLAFMLRVQLDQVPRKRVHDTEKTGSAWLWDDSIPVQKVEGGEIGKCTSTSRYSVRAPWSVVHRDSSMNTMKGKGLPEQTGGSDFRTMLKQTTSPFPTTKQTLQVKSRAMASVSHNSAMAERTTIGTSDVRNQ